VTGIAANLLAITDAIAVVSGRGKVQPLKVVNRDGDRVRVLDGDPVDLIEGIAHPKCKAGEPAPRK
jgi:hypothetical protein